MLKLLTKTENVTYINVLQPMNTVYYGKHARTAKKCTQTRNGKLYHSVVEQNRKFAVTEPKLKARMDYQSASIDLTLNVQSSNWKKSTN